MKIIRQQEGYFRILYGRDLNCSNRTELQIGTYMVRNPFRQEYKPC